MKITMKARLTTVKSTLLAFATPIHQVRYDGLGEFNAEVGRRILALREQSPGQQNSNQGGWQSEKDLLSKLGEPYGTQLARMFVENVRAAMESVVELTEPAQEKLSMDAWANVNLRGNSHALHIHPGCPWSGSYYVAAEPNSAGEIYFIDPRTSALMNNHPLNPFNATNHISIAPAPGMMLVFPSFVFHGVRPYEGTAPRISIAFNLR